MPDNGCFLDSVCDETTRIKTIDDMVILSDEAKCQDRLYCIGMMNMLETEELVFQTANKGGVGWKG